jgi:carboxymethylenebutenolidase
VTQAIAQWMRDMEHAWDGHRAAVLRGDLGAALAALAARPSVRHLPAMTGGSGRAETERFYAGDLLPHLPADLAVTRISRTVDRFRLVDEVTVTFTHDRELPWLLPGIAPGGRPAAVTAIAIAAFERGLVRDQRILWDYATLAAQLGMPGLVAVSY